MDEVAKKTMALEVVDTPELVDSTGRCSRNSAHHGAKRLIRPATDHPRLIRKSAAARVCTSIGAQQSSHHVFVG